MAGLAIVALMVGTSAWAQDRAMPRPEPVCGHHADPRGFSLDLPKGTCGYRYLHGLRVVISTDADAVERSITVWAARNSNVDAKSSDIAAAEMGRAVSDTVDGVRLTHRANTKVSGVAGVRWQYGFHSKTDDADHVVDLVAVLRPLRPKPEWHDYYEYSIVLRSTPKEHESDLKLFEEILKTFTFGEPEE
ncbi:MAG TPA: hypothetical protein VL691_05115 [Vicinamibacteria bacterium]|nr:hypothetical protein [Vicinamibacteria bacterium]